MFYREYNGQHQCDICKSELDRTERTRDNSVRMRVRLPLGTGYNISGDSIVCPEGQIYFSEDASDIEIEGEYIEAIIRAPINNTTGNVDGIRACNIVWYEDKK